MADAPTASASPTSSGRSPTTHEEVRSRLSASAAARAMPGIGFRSTLVRANSATVPSGWYGTVEEPVDVGPVLSEQAGDVAVHVFDIADVVEPSGDPGLVGHDRHRHLGPVQPGDGLRGAVDELDPVDGSDIAVIDDDRPVSVEQDARAGNGRTRPVVGAPTRRDGTCVLARPASRADQACSCQFGQLRHAL